MASYDLAPFPKSSYVCRVDRHLLGCALFTMTVLDVESWKVKTSKTSKPHSRVFQRRSSFQKQTADLTANTQYAGTSSKELQSSH